MFINISSTCWCIFPLWAFCCVFNLAALQYYPQHFIIKFFEYIEKLKEFSSMNTQIPSTQILKLDVTFLASSHLSSSTPLPIHQFTQHFGAFQLNCRISTFLPKHSRLHIINQSSILFKLFFLRYNFHPMNAHILYTPLDGTVYDIFFFLKHQFSPQQCSFFRSVWWLIIPWALVHCSQQAASSQCGGWGMGGGMVGADQPAVLAPFPSFGRAKVTWSSKTPKQGVEASHIPLAGTGKSFLRWAESRWIQS